MYRYKFISMITACIICTLLVRGIWTYGYITGATGIMLLLLSGALIGALHGIFWPDYYSEKTSEEKNIKGM